MANLLIGYPDIPFAAASIASSNAAATNKDATNLIAGARGLGFELAASLTGTLTHTYDLSAVTAEGAQYLYVADAWRLYKSGVASVTLKSHTANVVGSATTISTMTLPSTQSSYYGPGQEDYLITFAPSTARNWWFTQYAATTSTCPHSKVFFGTWFDLGRDPEQPVPLTREQVGSYVRRPAYTFSLNYRGITDATVQSFNGTIAAYADVFPLVLYDADSAVLPGCTTMLVQLKSSAVTPVTANNNTLALEFEELI